MIKDSLDAKQRDSLGINDKSVNSISFDLFERKKQIFLLKKKFEITFSKMRNQIKQI
jgi:hypothetical protein